MHWQLIRVGIVGDLVAIHRKVHLFDIDIPGKITFKVLSPAKYVSKRICLLTLRKARPSLEVPVSTTSTPVCRCAPLDKLVVSCVQSLRASDWASAMTYASPSLL